MLAIFFFHFRRIFSSIFYENFSSFLLSFHHETWKKIFQTKKSDRFSKFSSAQRTEKIRDDDEDEEKELKELLDFVPSLLYFDQSREKEDEDASSSSSSFQEEKNLTMCSWEDANKILTHEQTLVFNEFWIYICLRMRVFVQFLNDDVTEKSPLKSGLEKVGKLPHFV